MGWVQMVYGLSPCGVSIRVVASCLAVAVGLHLRHGAPCYAFDGVAGTSCDELGFFIFLFFGSSVVADDHSLMGGSDDTVLGLELVGSGFTVSWCRLDYRWGF